MKSLTVNLAILAAATAAGVGVLEGAARVIVAGRPPGRSGEQAAYTAFDPILGWRNRPGASVTYSRREYRTRVEINSLGFRDIERSPTKKPGTRRILVMGDSFIEAYAVERDKGITRRAEDSAANAGCPAEVINAGVHGYSIDQEYLWYRGEGRALDADVVVMAVYYNDIVQTVRTRYWGSPTPLLDMRDGQLTPVNTPLEPPPPTAPEVPKKRRIEGSALKFLVLERLITGAPRFYAQLAQSGLVSPFQPDSLPDELRVYKKRGHLAEVRAAWTRTGQILDAFADAVRADGAIPVVAHIPASFEVVDEDWDHTLMNYGLSAEAWDRSLVRNRLRELSQSSQSHFVDFTDELRASVGGWSGAPYFRHDGHWNDLGNDVAGQALVSFLQRNLLLRCSEPSGPGSSLRTRPRHGDMNASLTAP